MNIYLFLESSQYAYKIKTKLQKDFDVIIINSLDNLSEIDFKKNDILIIDAHVGKPKNQFKGLKLFDDYIERNLSCKVVVFSWFSIKQLWNTGIYFNFKNTYLLASDKEDNYIYLRFPIDINTLKKLKS